MDKPLYLRDPGGWVHFKNINYLIGGYDLKN